MGMTAGARVEVVTIETPALGDRSYRPVVILDVRRDQEWDASHITGAVHIPLHQLPSRLADVPEGEVWVHCEAGYRASVAASFLDAAGRTVVAVDDEFHRVTAAGLPVDRPQPQLAVP
jgi:hydroxyacylglutathione hydrolase